MYPSKELPQYCIFLHQQVKALVKNGIDITVIIPTTERECLKTEYDGIEIVYLKFRNYSRTALLKLSDFRLIKELKNFVDVNLYNVVYAIHGQISTLEFARAISVKYGKPLVVHYRGFNIFDEYETEKKVLFSNPIKAKEKIVKYSALSLGVSQKTTDIIKARFPNALTSVVYNGVDEKIFGINNEINNESDADNVIKLLCVANLIPIKGHKYLFEAFKTIQDKYPHLTMRLDVVGRGYYEDELKKFVEENRVKNVFFHGYMLYEKVAEFMKKADIFILPSVYESFGNVVLEAMSSRKAVVIFSGQGIDEIIKDGINGMIAKHADVADLTGKIESLVIDGNLRNTIAENAYEISKNYTWDKSAKCIIQNLNKILK